MYSTGIVRRIDELGRITIPKELRRILGIDIRDNVEIFSSGRTIVLKKYAPDCIFCGGTEDVMIFKNKNVCRKCRDEMAEESNDENNGGNGRFGF
jgi:transcriptional pleiotropic regulator of transition state genes